MKIKIPSKDILLQLIILIVIFKPAYLPIKELTYLYRVLQALSLTYLILQLLCKNIANYKLLILFGIYHFVCFFSTLININNIVELIEEILTSLLLILWFHYAIQKNPYKCVDMLMFVLGILIIVNLFTVLLFPEGLYRSKDAVVSARYGWVLGHQSLFSMYAAPAICISGLYWNNKRTIKSGAISLAVSGACVMQTIILGSANNLICLFGISIGTMILYVLNVKKYSFNLVYVIVIVFVLVISVFQATSFMEPLVVKYLHRDMTFTQRTFIWAKTIELIKNKWLIGYGIQSSDELMVSLGASHAHNQYLQCFYSGGVLGFISFWALMINSFKNLKSYVYIFAGKIMISAVVAWMFQMIFEVYFHHTMGRMLIILSFYFGQLCLINSREKIEEREDY